MIHGLRYPFIFYVFITAAIIVLGEYDIITILTRDSVLYACIISLFNLVVFYLIMEFSFQKSNNLFLILNIGGMGIRIAVMLLLVFITLKFLKIDEFEFIFTFFLLYFLFLVYEIMMLVIKIEQQSKKQNNTENVV